jgi:cyclase
MTRRSSVLATALVLAILLGGDLSAAEADVPYGIDVQKVADGVYAAIRTDPPGLWFDCNSVFIVGDQDVIVVDTNFTLTSARESIAALKKITDKPVRYVVNSHFHDDHVTGNQIYRETWPGVEFIGHPAMRVDLVGLQVENRTKSLAFVPEFQKMIRSSLESGKNFMGAPLSEEERISYLGDLRRVTTFGEEAPRITPVIPTLTVSDRMTFHRGDRTVEILHLGAGHSRADLVVRLPEEGIVISGDLVVWPVPLVGSTSFPAQYAETLEKMIALEPKTIIPGHGPLMHDTKYAALIARMLRSMTDQAAAAVVRGETLEQARKSIDLSEFRNAIAGESQMKRFVFMNYVAEPGIANAYAAAKKNERPQLKKN